MPRKTKKLSISSRPRLLVGAGWGLIFIFGLYRFYSLKILSFGTPTATIASFGPAPIAVNIPRVFLNLPITEATVTDGTWEISPDGASHWDNSANPGEPGNIVIYGHNKTNLFGPIRWLNFGDEIILTDADGGEHVYQVTQILTVSPGQTEYIQPKQEETLTLYTCIGLFDSQRYLVIAKPAGQ